MLKITYRYLNDGMMVKAVHARHQETLFFSLLLPAFERSEKSELIGDGLFEGIAEAWAIQELGLFGFVSTFHLWERQLKELFAEQEAYHRIGVPKAKSRENIVKYAERVLLEHFGVVVPIEQWKELDRARQVVNAFKHGQGQTFTKVMERFPNFFFEPEDRRHSPVVSVAPAQLEEFINTVVVFWEGIPYEINYNENSI